MQSIDQHFMAQALQQATIAQTQGEVPVGAIIVENNRVIARAHNQVQALQDPTAHAEMLAITAAAGFLHNKYLLSCTLYVTLEPCLMCATAMRWAQLSRLVYGAEDQAKGYRALCPAALRPATAVRQKVLHAQSSSMVQSFFNGKRLAQQRSSPLS